MANYENLKSAIQQVVKTNGNNEITGELLQQSLLAMINSLGVGYQFIGVATPATNPGTPDKKVFYMASTAGTYSDFGGLEVTEDEVVILTWDSSWHKVSTGLKNYDDTQLRELIAGKANLRHQHKVADITDFPKLYYDATDFFTSGAYPSDRYEELLEAVKAKRTVYATIDEEGYISYVFFVSSAHSHGSSSHVLLTTTFEDGGNLYINTFVLQQSGMTPLQENITRKADKATTLAGYGIGDAYTKSEVDAGFAAKQDTLQLTVKDNGNIVLANLQGQSKEFMPATPSGDPMHYAYEAAGAVWNGTGEDITRIGRMTGDTIVHKAGYWYLNELGDISNEEMRKILIRGRNSDCLRCYTSSISYSNKSRTNLYPLAAPTSLNWLSLEVVILVGDPERLDYDVSGNYSTIYTQIDNKCRKILTILDSNKFALTKQSSMVYLEFFKLKRMALSQYINSPYFREDCILYMIQNEAATSAITITLHADAYVRAMANADIVAALEAHPNVSLASA